MAINDLPILSALRTKMQWHQERQRVLAENVSNANTPNFRPSDLVAPKFDSKGTNADATMGSLAMMRTSATHIGVSGGAPSFRGDGGRSGFLLGSFLLLLLLFRSGSRKNILSRLTLGLARFDPVEDGRDGAIATLHRVTAGVEHFYVLLLGDL